MKSSELNIKWNEVKQVWTTFSSERGRYKEDDSRKNLKEDDSRKNLLIPKAIILTHTYPLHIWPDINPSLEKMIF